MSKNIRILLVVGFSMAVMALVAFSAGGREGGCPLGGGCPIVEAGCGPDGCKPPAKGPTTKPCCGCKDRDKDGQCKEGECKDDDRKKCKKAECTKVVNAKCPIMGGAVDPAKVPAKRTRTHKGQEVGFCCGGCLPKWDDLSVEDKDAKLAAVLRK